MLVVTIGWKRTRVWVCMAVYGTSIVFFCCPYVVDVSVLSICIACFCCYVCVVVVVY